MASNQSTLADEDGDYSDWIELYNTTDATVPLNQWYLTDNANNRTKWRFPDVSIPPHGYLIIFASDKNRTVPGQPLHTSWALSAGGEYLGLIMPDGQTVVHEYAPNFPAQFPDVSYGLLNGEHVFFQSPTPGAPNASGVVYAADPVFSHQRGFYDEPFDLLITTTTPDATIRYTTNGSPPSLTNGHTYTGPLPINRTTVLRAAAFKTGYEPSRIETHTYIFVDDVITQSTNSALASGFPATWGSHRVDYGMDPDVVNNPLYSGTIRDDLKSLPTVSIVMSMDDLFHPETGFYANSTQTGRDWERQTSIELIHPSGEEGFQVNSGIRIRGAFSTSLQNPKHSFRLFFRGEYGNAKLNYALFGDQGTDTFDGFDLASAQNWTWHIHQVLFAGEQAVYVRDQFARDTQLAMGHHAERGIFTHVYINGHYWGVYCASERPEASYAESYFGGSKEDYDVIKSTGPPNYDIEATDGTMDAWTTLWQIATNGFESEANYQLIQGNNPDGTRNPDYPILLDVDNLIDYQLIAIYTGSRDGPVTAPGDRPNNWFGIYRRDGSQGFKFFVHDFEHTLMSLTEDRTGTFAAGNPGTGGGLLKSSPQYLWQRLQQNSNFVMRVADRIHLHFFNGGVLTPESALARFKARTNEIHRALVAESARWGDAQRPTPYTRDASWMPLIDNLQTNYFPQRTAIVLNQLRNRKLYPDVAAPSFNQHGGTVPDGFELSISAPAGTIYFTQNGSDPRLPDNSISPNALVYSTPLQLTEHCTVKARVFSGGIWSALNEASFTIHRDFEDVLITEIMYNPPDENGIDGEAFEFIELKNVSGEDRDLSGVSLTSGIQFTFPNGTILAPGAFIVLVSDPVAFASKYPGVPIGGVYSGQLSNGGETITLTHVTGDELFSVTYDDSAPWPVVADGQGFSLVPKTPNYNPNPNNGNNWRASANIGGSPGEDDPTPGIPTVVINEILTHTDPPQQDSVELYNPTESPADISHWFLTDDRAEPFKFQIPPGTMIPANGFIVFTQDDFDAPASPTRFRFSSYGEEVYLYSANAGGQLTGYSTGASFGAAPNGVSFGRYITSTGESRYPAQTEVTLGTVNSGPRVGPIVINEIHYSAASIEDQFIELKNITDQTVSLFDPAYPTNRWRLNGVGFAFPQGTIIEPNGLFLVVAIDPATFRARHNIPDGIPIFGPWSGTLQKTGEQLDLQRPDKPDLDDNNNVVVPYISVDTVRYSNQSPWPEAAAQGTSSLERIDSTAFGDDPINWKARAYGVTPGVSNNVNLPPSVEMETNLVFVSSLYPFSTSLNMVIHDDDPAAVSVSWQQVGGPAAVNFPATNVPQPVVTFPKVGTYLLAWTVTDGDFSTNAQVQIAVDHPSPIVELIPSNSQWKYLDNGSNQGTSWKEPAFNDSQWKSGYGIFGYGDGIETTTISYGPVSTSKYITSYFRKQFTVSNTNNITALTVKLLRDDGAIVYLNGAEVLRDNMPAGTVHYLTTALNVVSGADESTYFSFVIPPDSLVEGNNVIAVELHQANGNGTDAGFDMELTANIHNINQPPAVSAGTNFTIRLPREATLNGIVTDDGFPLTPGFPELSWNKFSGPGEVEFFQPNALQTIARFSEAGIYILRLTANDGEAETSSDVTVAVEPETFLSWSELHFTLLEQSNPEISGPMADPDMDGFTNAEEFIAGTNPRDSQSFLRFDSAVQSIPGTVTLKVHVPERRSYSILQSDDPVNNGWTKLQDISALLTPQTYELQDSSTNSSRFYRIVAPAQP